MAERAVLSRRRDDGRYECCRSRWGGTDRALAAVCAGVSPAALPVTWERRRGADAFRQVVLTLDYLSTDALYRGRQPGTTVFLPLWFGLPLLAATPSPGVGALVEVASLPDARLLRADFRRLKNALADATVTGGLPATAAPLVLLSAVASLRGRERHSTLVPEP